MNTMCNLIQNYKNRLAYPVGVAIVFVIFFSVTVFARETISNHISLEVPGYEVGGDIVDISDFPVGIITDNKGTLSIDDIAARQNPDAVISSRFNIPSDKDSYWFVFTLINSGQNTVKRIIRLDEPYIETADIYYRDQKEWQCQKNGLVVPIAQRRVPNRVPVFLITLQPKETRTIYLRFHSKYVLTLGIAVETIKEFAAYEQWQIFLYAIVFGAGGSILLYNLFLYFYLRNRAYIYYVLYGTCFLIFVSLYSGYFLYISSRVSLYYDMPFFTSLMVAFIGAFTRQILDTRKTMPRLDKALMVFMGLYVLIAVLIVIDIYFYQWLVIFGMPSTLIFLTAGVYGVIKGIPIARYYVIAISVYLVGLFMIAAVNIGVVPYNLFTRYGYLAGSLIELVVFSLALGFQFKLIQDEKLNYKNELLNAEKVTREKLEILVQERTVQLEDANRELKRISVMDGLTGLYNRRHFDDTLDLEWKRLQRTGLPLSLLMCDIDHFKIYNDTFGHQAGDDCIRSVAKAITGAVGRGADTAARYGGEEFAVIIPDTHTKGAVKIAQTIQQELSRKAISHPKTKGFKVTMSFGVATLFPSIPPGSAELVAKADEALYQSKKNGRNQITVAAESKNN